MVCVDYEWWPNIVAASISNSFTQLLVGYLLKQVWKLRWNLPSFVGLLVPLTVVQVLLLKMLFARTHADYPLGCCIGYVLAMPWSMPSAHAAIGSLLCAFYAINMWREARMRVSLVVFYVLLVLASRFYLHLNGLPDLAAGVLLGTFIATVTMRFVQFLDQRSDEKAGDILSKEL
jgi:membrane-associated phospholipid phosphatase